MNWLPLLCVCVAFLASSTDGYYFACLDGCECDTDAETVHCHNRPSHQTFQLPEKRLSGFRYIGLTNNDIVSLPSEEMLFEKFPELKAVDVENNANFDCSTLPHYKTLEIISDCGKDPSELVHVTIYPVTDATVDCDAECQVQKHYDALKQYFTKLWNLLKEKFNQVSKTQMVRDASQSFDRFIANIKEKIQNARNSD